MTTTNLERRSIQIPVHEGDGPHQPPQPPPLCPCCSLEPHNVAEDEDEECLPMYRIGTGAFCHVFAAQYYGGVVAQKVPRRQSFGHFDDEYGLSYEENVQRLMVEGMILKGLNHPNIVRVYKYKCSPPELVMELHEQGSLHDTMRRCPEIVRDKRRMLKWARQIASAMRYWHRRGDLLCHGDLTTANILISAAGDAIICDAGMAKYKDNAQHLVHEVPEPENRNYLRQPPEAILNKTYGEKSDVYTFAFILYEMVMGEEPFEIPYPGCIHGMQQQIARERMHPSIPENLEELPGWCPKLLDCISLIKRCWSSYLDERPTFAEIEEELEHTLQALDRPVEEKPENRNTLIIALAVIASVVMEPAFSTLLWTEKPRKSVCGNGSEQESNELLEFSAFAFIIGVAAVTLFLVYNFIRAAQGRRGESGSSSGRIVAVHTRAGTWLKHLSPIPWGPSEEEDDIPDSPFKWTCPPELYNGHPESSYRSASQIPPPNLREWRDLRLGLLHDIGNQPESPWHEEVRRFCETCNQNSCPDAAQWSKLMNVFVVNPETRTIPSWTAFEAKFATESSLSPKIPPTTPDIRSRTSHCCNEF